MRHASAPSILGQRMLQRQGQGGVTKSHQARAAHPQEWALGQLALGPGCGPKDCQEKLPREQRTIQMTQPGLEVSFPEATLEPSARNRQQLHEKERQAPRIAKCP